MLSFFFTAVQQIVHVLGCPIPVLGMTVKQVKIVIWLISKIKLSVIILMESSQRDLFIDMVVISLSSIIL